MIEMPVRGKRALVDNPHIAIEVWMIDNARNTHLTHQCSVAHLLSNDDSHHASLLVGAGSEGGQHGGLQCSVA